MGNGGEKVGRNIRKSIKPFISEGIVYGQVIKMYESDKGKFTVVINLANNEIIKRDKKLADMVKKKIKGEDIGNLINIKDHLFFYWMNIEISNKNLIEKMKLRLETGDFYEYKIFKKKLFDKVIEPIGEILFDNKSQIQNIISRYYQCAEDGNYVFESRSEEIVLGSVYFSASPMQMEKYIITIKDEKLDELYNTKVLPELRFRDKEEFDLSIKEFSDNKSLKVNSIEVFNVGQGHNSRISFVGRADKWFYDIGYTKSYNADKTNKIESLESKDTKCIILSHWDLDHYLGLTIFKDSSQILEAQWIAPSNIGNAQVAVRIANLIYIKSGKKFLVSEDLWNNNIFELSDNFKFYKGNGRTKNESGISLDINLESNKRVVTLGDNSYEHLPEEINNEADEEKKKVDVLIVPHHGGISKGEIAFLAKDNTSRAIIPTGDTSNRHPRDETIEALANAGFKDIVKTYEAKPDDNFTITIS